MDSMSPHANDLSSNDKRKAQKALARSSAETVSDLGQTLSSDVVKKIYSEVVSDLANKRGLNKFRREHQEPSVSGD